MQIHKNEITTGLLVLVTFGILIVVLVVIGMPGVFKPVNTYRIYPQKCVNGGVFQGFSL